MNCLTELSADPGSDKVQGPSSSLRLPRRWMPIRVLAIRVLAIRMLAIGALASSLVTGCADSPSDSTTASSGKTSTADDAASSTNDADSNETNAPPRFIKPVTLGGGKRSTDGSGSDSGNTVVDTAPPKFEEVVAGLKPIQIVLGSWTGILKNASIHEGHEWVWDLKSDPVFPALVATIPDGNFFATARLTYDPRVDEYLMTTTTGAGAKQEFRGRFLSPPEEVPGDDGKTLQKNFELELTQVANDESGERFRYVIKQQNNDRYLMTIFRARGAGAFRQVDVVGTQRDGVSFAKASDDYGDRTCVISGGLGTITVAYKGKSYYVCCTGCKAAFEDDPETWIARFEEASMKK